MKKKQKGFTLVELLVVIAILAVLATVSILGYSSFTRKANISNDQSIVSQMNLALQSSETLGEKAEYCDQAVDQCVNAGFILENLTPSTSGLHFAYDQEYNRFMLLNEDYTFEYGDSKHTDVENKPWNVFVVVGSQKEIDNAKINNKYFSIYSRQTFEFADSTKTIEVHSGLDTGKCIDFTLINYTNNGDAQTVIIHTNSINSELKIVAPKDTVNHYGFISNVNVVRTANSSYHEFGSSFFVKVQSGRVVAENGGKINTIVLVEKQAIEGETGEVLKAIIENNGGTITKVAATSNEIAQANNDDTKSVKLVLQVKNGNEITEAGDIIVVSQQNENNLNDEIVKLQNEANSAGREVFQKQCTHNLVENKCTICGFDGYKWSEIVASAPNLAAANDAYEIKSDNDLAVFARMVNDGNNFSGKIVKLVNNIDLKGYAWTPIGNESKAFSGTFDGNNKTITGLYVNWNNVDAGLFGKIADGTIKNLNIKNANVQNIGGFCAVLCGHAYTGSIQNITIENSNVKSTGEYVGAINGQGYASIMNCTVEGCEITGSEQVGGLLGYKTETSAEFSNNIVKNSSITAESRSGGLIGKAQFASSNICKVNNNTVENCIVIATNGSSGGLFGQIMGSNDKFEIKNNTVKVTLQGTTTQGLWNIRDGQNATFTSTLSNSSNVSNNSVTIK